MSGRTVADTLRHLYPKSVLESIVAGITLLFYDHALTFGAEVQLVWKAPFSIAKVLFLLARYITPVTSIIALVAPLHPALDLQKSCKVGLALAEASFYIASMTSDLLLIIRVYAIWQQSMRVLLPLIMLFIATYTVNLVAVTQYRVVINENGDPYGSCFDSQAPGILIGGFAVAPVLDSAIFTLTVAKALQHWRTHQIRTPLLTVFYRDGLAYYLLFPALQIVQLVGVGAESTNLYLYLKRSLNVVLITRMFLNLRSVRTHEDWSAATSLRFRPVVQGDDKEDQSLSTQSVLDIRIARARES